MLPAGVGAAVVWLLALRRGPQPWLEDTLGRVDRVRRAVGFMGCVGLISS